MQFPFPILVCDIGGTNVRLARIDHPGGALRHLQALKTADYPGLAEALAPVAAMERSALRSCLVCAAGPVEGRKVKLTNAAWALDGPAIAKALGLEQGLLFNDFEAQALSLPSIRPEWTRPIGPEIEGDGGPRLIHGPGTGLGTSALIDVTGRWRAIASEAAHSDFAPVGDEDHRYWPYIEPREGRITPEALISGPGLRRLHRARMAASGHERPDLEPDEIMTRAFADRAGEEFRTIGVFWRLVARFAGDLALTFVATGGVTLAGGVLPRIVDLLDEEQFRAAFENKAPYGWLAKRIPVRLLMEPDTVLAGMADIAADPDRYAIDYAARAWM